MKGHQRQISEQVRRVKQTIVDSSPYRLEVFAKNFKKKNQLQEPASSSTLNMGKHFELNRKTEIKGSPSRYQNKNKTSRKRSLQKFMSNHRVTQRISFNHPNTANQPPTLSTKSKMMKINSILCTKVSGNNKSLINEVQNRYDQYRNIVKEWKGLGIFDEVDKLVMNLIENYVETIEKMMENMCFEVSEKMKKYEQYVTNLEIENKKVKQEIQAYTNIEEMINPVRQKLLDEYEKCQWSTFVLNSLAQQSFDLEGFIKELPLYRKWIAPVIMQEQLKKQKQKQRMHVDLKIEDFTKPTLRSKSALINGIKSQIKDVGQV